MTDTSKAYDHAVCVNLDRDKYRWSLVQTRFKRAGLDVERWSAVDGMVRFPGTKNPGSLGCYATHLEIWEALLKSADEQWLVFEDDVILADDFANKLEFYYSQIPWDWEYLFVGHNGHHGHKFLDNPYIIINEPKRTPPENAGTWAYMIRRKGAEKMLDELSDINDGDYIDVKWRNIDIALRVHMCTIAPIICHHDDSAERVRLSMDRGLYGR